MIGDGFRSGAIMTRRAQVGARLRLISGQSVVVESIPHDPWHLVWMQVLISDPIQVIGFRTVAFVALVTGLLPRNVKLTPVVCEIIDGLTLEWCDRGGWIMVVR